MEWTFSKKKSTKKKKTKSARKQKKESKPKKEVLKKAEARESVSTMMQKATGGGTVHSTWRA